MNEVSASRADINIAIKGPFWVVVANPEHPFMAMLILGSDDNVGVIYLLVSLQQQSRTISYNIYFG